MKHIYKYPVIIEKSKDGVYGAYLPDLPGCVAAADTVAEVKKLIKSAAKEHIAWMLEDGEKLPEPSKHFELDLEIAA